MIGSQSIIRLSAVLILFNVTLIEATNLVIKFLSEREASVFLAAPDEFVNGLSPFDRSSRLQVGRVVEQAEYLKHISEQAEGWTAKEQRRLGLLLDDIRIRMGKWNLPWPKYVLFIKTTGKEEGNAAYTRRNAVILPSRKLMQKDDSLRRLLVHELFHVLSRANPKLTTRLYRLIGYLPVTALKFPRELLTRKLTNPDAPFSRHAITVNYMGQSVKVAPILYSRIEKYDEERGGGFFRYLMFRLLVLDEVDSSKAARDSNGKLILLMPTDAKGFNRQIGANTSYVIHPEEIMADNFMFLVLGKEDLPNPEIVKRMRAVLGGKLE